MEICLGVDAGNDGGKVVGLHGHITFKTNICDWFDRDIEETFGPDDMEFEIDGRKGFAGSIAANEDEFGGVNMYGDSKAHEDAKIRVLLAIHRYIDRYCPNVSAVYIVVGQPIKRHKKTEKDTIKSMLKGRHDFIVNGRQVSIHIKGVEVSPEGSAAYWGTAKKMGTIRILDIGSGTVNAATIKDKRHINTASGTFNFGVETVRNKDDLEGIARGIVRNTTKLKWSKNDIVLICGGKAEEIGPFIEKHYAGSEILYPAWKYSSGMNQLHPVFANAVGFYELAKGGFSI